MGNVFPARRMNSPPDRRKRNILGLPAGLHLAKLGTLYKLQSCKPDHDDHKNKKSAEEKQIYA